MPDNTLLKEATEVLSEYGYEDISTDDVDEYIVLDSVEELEGYLKQIDEMDNQYDAEIPVSANQNPILSRANGIHTITWWNPFAGFDGVTLLCWSNVDLTYKYKHVNNKPQFQSVSKVTSYISGLSATTWKQTSYSTSFTKTNSTKDTCKVTVKGTYKIGIDIGGTLLGATRKSTWNCSLRLY